jgi:hypothetical protein
MIYLTMMVVVQALQHQTIGILDRNENKKGFGRKL